MFVELFRGLCCSVRIEVIALVYLFSCECLDVTCVVVLESVFLQILALYSTIKMMHGPINIQFTSLKFITLVSYPALFVSMQKYQFITCSALSLQKQ